jgi:hypothetical protein
MSSDPTRPNPEWWQSQEPQADQGFQDPQGNQASQGPQGTQRFPAGGGYDQGPPSGQQGSGYQQGSNYQQGSGYQQDSNYQQNPGYQQDSSYQQSPGYQAPQPRYRRRRRRKWPLVTLIVIIIILVGGDRVACAIAENQMASQVKQQGFPVKPHVTIEGFPFLTQLAAKDFKTVQISASNVTVGVLEIQSLNATIKGMHINSSFNGAKVDSINGTALVTFAALAQAGGIPQGIQLTADGPDQVKATVNIAIVTATVVARVTRTSPTQFNVRVVQAGDVPTSLLGNLANFTINVPKSALPAGLTIQSVAVTQAGLRITVVGHNTTLSQ